MTKHDGQFDADTLVAELRRRGITQIRLAELCGVARQTINRAVKGDCTAKTAKLIARQLDVPVETFYHKDKPEELTPAEQRVVNVMRQAPEAAERITIYATAIESMVKYITGSRL